ncbi:MAG: DNA-binding domain-containing protein [Pseudomonadota bacterium]
MNDIDRFAALLMQPGQPLPDGWCRAAPGADLAFRFDVYRRNVHASLIEALAEGFPVVRQLVGEDCFATLARDHLREHPPASPVLTEWGDAFADMLEPWAVQAGVPYVPDVARLERARVRAFHAAEAPTLAASALADCLARPERLGRLRLRVHPSVSLIESRHGVASLWLAHSQGADADALARVPLWQPQAALVLRRDDQVPVHVLTPHEARLLRRLLRADRLGDAAHAMDPGDLARALATLLVHGVFAGLDDGPAEGPWGWR